METADKLGGFMSRFKKNTEARRFSRSVSTDWRIICFSFLIINIIVIVWNVYRYNDLNSGSSYVAQKMEPVNVKTMDRHSLEQIVAYFERKKIKFEALKYAPLETSDPFVLFKEKK